MECVLLSVTAELFLLAWAGLPGALQGSDCLSVSSCRMPTCSGKGWILVVLNEATGTFLLLFSVLKSLYTVSAVELIWPKMNDVFVFLDRLRLYGMYWCFLILSHRDVIIIKLWYENSTGVLEADIYPSTTAELVQFTHGRLSCLMMRDFAGFLKYNTTNSPRLVRSHHVSSWRLQINNLGGLRRDFNCLRVEVNFRSQKAHFIWHHIWHPFYRR